jgi:Tfp pilus assembly protein PilP
MRIGFAIAFAIGLGTPVAAQSVPASNAQPATPAVASVEQKGYTYNPQGRRDPFVSLLRRAADAQLTPVGARPGGLAGLAIGEVALKGVLRGQDGYLGILLGVDKKSYIVRPGDRLLDGTVRTIAADSMVIVQQLNDPMASPKQRDVRKTLRQLEEAK